MADLDLDKHSRKRDRAEDKVGRKSKGAIRYKDNHDSHKHKKHKSKHDKKEHVKVIDDDDEGEVWIEKNIDGETLVTQDIPTAESLKLTSRAYELETDPPLPPSNVTESQPTRDDWMLEPKANPTLPNDETTLRGDFFSSMGVERKRKEKPERPDPDAPVRHVGLWNPNKIEVTAAEVPTPVKPPQETADEENRSVEDVALDRFGSLEAFEEAKEERRVLDEREGRRASLGKRDHEAKAKSQTNQQYMFSDVGTSALVGRSVIPGDSSFYLNTYTDSYELPARISKLRTSTSELNKLQAKVLKAKLMGSPNATQLEKEYELARAHHSGVTENETGEKVKVEVLPTLDARGRLYDVGQGKNDQPILPGNKKKKEKVETRDPKTGEVRYNADDDSTTLGDMLRQEKFGAGIADQKSMDAQLARAIMGDGKFEDDLEYMDDNAEKLGRKKMRSDAMKRQFAIHDYARTKKILDTCPHCYGEDDSPPKVGVIAMATRCYLASTTHEELVEGHCQIVPIQHHLSMLEADDDVWDEVRNFMKCLMRMFAEEDKGVIFYETVLNLKWQKHTCIECVPESILQSEAEWSQHKKLIDFSARPGGFRRAMVPNLPYFMVQWDHKGEKGYGHVIEGTGEAADGGDADGAIDEGAKGGGEFPRYFAAEIIGNQLDVEPRRWRRPRRIDFGANKTRVKAFNAKYAKFDWTGMIPKG
ncbi:hypothetical protein Clacol_009971 [Clathrus columnatus]|uniref:Uncharacterized protein n=1 Tax=Clathrus columnatus TaxID=1419009 RepID=A0AAV5AQC7_9AGAM|nr:hypothetical protein Clacol_009971 [Clathrus columnatus]